MFSSVDKVIVAGFCVRQKHFVYIPNGIIMAFDAKAVYVLFWAS